MVRITNIVVPIVRQQGSQACDGLSQRYRLRGDKPK